MASTSDGSVGTVAQIQRPARGLLGWMSEEQALQFLASQRRDVTLATEQQERYQAARKAVSKRKAGVVGSAVVFDPPQTLSAHLAKFQEAPAIKPFFEQGWRLAVADLTKVCSLQPQVFVDHAEERTAAADPNDLQSLAEVSLPIPSEVQLPAQFDTQQQAWMISGPNPNLRIIGNWAGPIQPGVVGFGFAVTLTPSFLQVAHVQDRYLLRDGYHRAVGFLKRGISKVPVLVRDYGEFEDLGLPPGLFSPAVYLGQRPPTLADFLDDDVSADSSLPAFQRMIVIHGMQLTPLG